MKLALVAVLVAVAGALGAPSVTAAPAIRTSAAAAVSVDACGPQPLKSDGTPWRCTFDDEFNGNTLDRSHWLPQTAFASGTSGAFACYVDQPSTVSVGGGSLNLVVHRTATPVSCGGVPTSYVAGMVTTYHLFSQEYGRFEVRMRNTATTVPGLHEAFWLWPDDRYPAPLSLFGDTGEIDVSETYSVQPDLSIPYLHYSAGLLGVPVDHVNTAWDCVAYRGQWNTYTMEWSPSRLEIFVNQKSCLVNTANPTVMQRPYIVALTAALGGPGNAYDGRAPLPATTNVDYVRVWK